MSKQAVLLLAHGTPETVEQIPEYLRNVVSGRPVPQAVVEEIQHRYSLIGKSPLTEITNEQARLVEAELNGMGEANSVSHPSDKDKDVARVGHPASHPSKAWMGHPRVPVYVGMRNWRPYIPDVVKQMRADGVEEAAVICMAPQNSRTSVGLYRRAVEAEASGLRIDFTAGWAEHPLLADAFAERLRPALAKLTAEVGEPVPVLFTAHSVPTRTVVETAPQSGTGTASHPNDKNKGVVRMGHPEPRLWPGPAAAGDPYAEDARRTAELVAARVPEIPRWWFAFQSQGASGGPWIGPSVEETLDRIAGQGVKALILQPIGFLCDHVEILFDVDILFREYASKKQIKLERPESLNASPTLARAVADLAGIGLLRLRDSSAKG
ncbi:MAG: ferrochelatase [Terracidiphilus sp.]